MSKNTQILRRALKDWLRLEKLDRSQAVRELGLASGAERQRKQIAELLASMWGEPARAEEFTARLQEALEAMHPTVWQGVPGATTMILDELIATLAPPEVEPAGCSDDRSP